MSFATGFMTGAANALGDHLDRKAEKKAQREEDLFRLRGQVYVKNLDTINERKKVESERLAAVSSNAALYGWTEEQERVFGQNAIERGWSPSQIDKLAENSDPYVVKDDSSPSAIEQTGEMLSEEDTPRENSVRGGGKTSTRDSDSPELRMREDDPSMNEFISFMSDGTGQSPEEVRMIMRGATTNKITSALKMELRPKSQSQAELIKDVTLDNIDDKIAVQLASGNQANVDFLYNIRSSMIEQRHNTMLRNPEGAKFGLAMWTDDEGNSHRVNVRYNDAGFWLPGKNEATPYSAYKHGVKVVENKDIKFSEQIAIQKHLEPGSFAVHSVEALVREAGDMIALSKEDSASGTGAGSMMQSIRRTAVEFQSLAKFGEIVNGNDGLRVFREKINGYIDDIDGTKFGANAKSLANKKITFALKYMESLKQTGKDVSNKDLSLIMDSIFDPDPAKLEYLLTNVLESAVTNGSADYNLAYERSKGYPEDVVGEEFQKGDLGATVLARFGDSDTEAARMARKLFVKDTSVTPGEGMTTNTESEPLLNQTPVPDNVPAPTARPEGNTGNMIKTGEINKKDGREIWRDKTLPYDKDNIFFFED